MNRNNKKKVITAVTGAAVLGVAATALGNASELETLFNPAKFEKYENRHKTTDYDYTAGNGEDVDLADENINNAEEESGKNEQQAIQVQEETEEEDQEEKQQPETRDSLGIIDENQPAKENDKKTGVEFTNTQNPASTENTDRQNSENSNNSGSSGTGNNRGNSGTDNNKKADKNGDSNSNTGKNDNTGTNGNTGNSGNNGANGNTGNNSNNSNNSSPGNNPDNSNSNTPTPVPNTPTPVPTQIPEALKPRDPYVTDDGLQLKSISAKISKEYYFRGDKFSADDAVVTATFTDSKGNTVTKELSCGGKDGYRVSFSTNQSGNQTAVFTYGGQSARAAYKVLGNVVFPNYMATFANDNKYYVTSFPGKALKTAIGEEAYEVLQTLAGTAKCQPVSGGVVDFMEIHRRMIAILGNAEIKEVFRNWTFGESYQNVDFLAEGADGYLTKMLEGFSFVANGVKEDSRGYVYYPVYDWGSNGRSVANIMVEVPEGYKIRRETQNDDDMSEYKGDQVLEKYTGTDTTITVPMGVTKIALKEKNKGVTKLIIPQSVQTVDINSITENLPDLTEYEMEDNLTSFQDFIIKDGLMYSKDGRTLLSIPSGCKEMTIPDTVKYLEEGCFSGLSEDAVIHFAGENPPVLKGETGFKGKITVPDSDYDTICKTYMFAFGREGENITFGSENGESGLYTYLENGPVLVYEKEQNVLAGIPQDKKGSITIDAPVTAIGAGALAGCDGLTDIILGSGITELQEESLVLPAEVETITLTGNKVTVSDKVFGDPKRRIKIPDIRIYVNENAYEDYLTSWSEVLDPVYGEGTARKLLYTETDSYIYEDGVKYQEIRSGKETCYKLIRLYQKTRTSCKIKENTTAVAENAFAGCENLEIVYIPSSVSGVLSNCFEYCTALETVAVENSELFKDEKIILPENAELMTAGEEFDSFIFEDGILNGTNEDGTHVLLNVATDYCEQVNIKENTIAYYKEAFKGCNQLTGIYDPSPSEMQEIGENCFEDCTEIKYFDFSDCQKLTTVSSGAFRNCTALSSIRLPESVKTIGQEAFFNCENLMTVNMTGVEEIGDRAFYGCDSLMVTGDIDNLHILGSQAFYSCRNLRSMELPDELESMGEGCFENCTGLTSVKINGNLQSVSRYCFYGCRRLAEVTFSEATARSGALRMIGVKAFAQCTSLENIDLRNLNALKLMGEGTFEGCTSLTTVKFPEAFQKLPDYCFEGCRNLSIVQLPGEEVVDLGEKVFGSSLPSFLHIWVQNEKVSEYQTAYTPVLDPLYGDGTTANILGVINDKMEIIQGVMFKITDEGKVLISASADLEGVYILPEDTVKIEADAFAGCNKLTQLKISYNTAVSLGDRCFKGCQNLIYIDIQGSIPEWGEETFMDCPNLTQVYLGANINGVYTQIDRIGTRAFKNCTSLNGDYAVNIRTDAKVWGEECFAGCTQLSTVAMVAKARSSLEAVEDRAFYGCSKLRTLITSSYSNLKTIGAYAFSECDSLAQPSIPQNVTSIGEGCFMNCDNLKYVSFYGAVEEYPKDCFRNCPNLIRTGGTAAAFGGLKCIGENAYAGCTTLQNSASWSLGRYSNLEEIGAGAFNGCTSLTDSSLSATVTSIGAGAFDGCTALNILVVNATEPPVMGGFSLSTMPENFSLLVPNSQKDDDSIYRAYLLKLTDLLGQEEAFRILDSISDGAKERYEEEMKEAQKASEELTPTPVLQDEENTEISELTVIPAESQQETESVEAQEQPGDQNQEQVPEQTVMPEPSALPEVSQEETTEEPPAVTPEVTKVPETEENGDAETQAEPVQNNMKEGAS